MTNQLKQRKLQPMDGGFKVHAESKTLSHRVSEKVVRYAKKKLDKSSVIDFCDQQQETQETVENFEHSQLDLGQKLGHGSFSCVYEIQAIRKSSDSTFSSTRTKYCKDKYVVKVLRPKLADNPAMLSACAADLIKEGMLMAILNHANVVKVHGWARNGVTAYSSGRHDAFFLVLDRLQETLRTRLDRWQKKQKPSAYKSAFTTVQKQQSKQMRLLKERTDSIVQLAKAVEYLHSKRILHRDLKPDNIGYDVGGNLKVFDFDVARIVPESVVPDETFLLTKRIGSPRYMAPEIARAEEYNLTADVYTFGLLCYQLLTLEKPYKDVPSGQHDDYVFFAGFRPALPESWPTELKTVVSRCWSEKIPERPSMKEAHQLLAEEAFPSLLRAGVSTIVASSSSSSLLESQKTNKSCKALFLPFRRKSSKTNTGVEVYA